MQKERPPSPVPHRQVSQVCMETCAPAGASVWVTVWLVCVFCRGGTESREGPRGGRESEAAVLVIPEIFGEAS